MNFQDARDARLAVQGARLFREAAARRKAREATSVTVDARAALVGLRARYGEELVRLATERLKPRSARP
jgi:carbon monoxide dehydrogenase subunit G